MGTRRAGFTLVEVLIALGTTAIIMTIAWMTYAGASVSAARCRAFNGTQQEARALLAMMARELRCVCPPPQVISAEEELPALAGAGSAGDAALTVLTGGAVPPPGLPRVGLCRVSYRLEEGSGVLGRGQEWLMGGSSVTADGGGCPPVARGVEELKLSFYDGDDWRTEWDSSEEGGLPRAVTVELTLSGEGGRSITYATTVCPACLNALEPAGEAVPAAGSPADRNRRSLRP